MYGGTGRLSLRGWQKGMLTAADRGIGSWWIGFSGLPGGVRHT